MSATTTTVDVWGAQCAVDLFKRGEQVAANLDGAGHISLAEIELGIPHPTEQGRTALEQNGRDRGTGCRWPFKPVPEHEPNGRGCDG